MLTLTYRPDADWAPGQISSVVRHIRQWLARKGHEMRFVWGQEFTKKGRPHYHLLLWLPLGLTIPKPDKQRWWPWGMTKIEWARNAVGYIAKYASKGDALHQPAQVQTAQVGAHRVQVLPRQRVEQRHVRGQDIALRREVLGPQPVEPLLVGVVQQQRDDQRLGHQTKARAPLPSTVTPPALTW